MKPDWSGETAVIAAAGPSITKAQVERARGKARVIVINESWRLATWADVLYACDWQWWGRKAPRKTEFLGLRVMGQKPPKHFPEVMRRGLDTVDLIAGVRSGSSSMIFEDNATGAGSNSAFQAANLAVKWGAARLILLGVDCHSPNEHWHGGHTHIEAPTQNAALMEKWLTAWRNAKPQLDERGVEVVNCSPGSAVKSLPVGRIEEVFP